MSDFNVSENEIVAVVDNFVDNLDVDELSYQLEEIGMTLDQMMDRIKNEINARLSGGI